MFCSLKKTSVLVNLSVKALCMNVYETKQTWHNMIAFTCAIHIFRHKAHVSKISIVGEFELYEDFINFCFL